jgi:hypothetical protein
MLLPDRARSATPDALIYRDRSRPRNNSVDFDIVIVGGGIV